MNNVRVAIAATAGLAGAVIMHHELRRDGQLDHQERDWDPNLPGIGEVYDVRNTERMASISGAAAGLALIGLGVSIGKNGSGPMLGGIAPKIALGATAVAGLGALVGHTYYNDRKMSAGGYLARDLNSVGRSFDENYDGDNNGVLNSADLDPRSESGSSLLDASSQILFTKAGTTEITRADYFKLFGEELQTSGKVYDSLTRLHKADSDNFPARPTALNRADRLIAELDEDDNRQVSSRDIEIRNQESFMAKILNKLIPGPDRDDPPSVTRILPAAQRFAGHDSLSRSELNSFFALHDSNRDGAVDQSELDAIR